MRPRCTLERQPVAVEIRFTQVEPDPKSKFAIVTPVPSTYVPQLTDRNLVQT